VLAGGAVVLIRRLPRAWPPVAGLAGAGLTALLIFAAPLVLEPLAYRFTPLPDGPVRDEVVRVLEAAGTQVDELLVADASRRTTKQNAYVSGLGGTRRVVLFDTLVQGRSAEEVGVVLAHELGHDRNRDLARNALFGAAGSVTAAYALAGALALARRRGLTGVSPRGVAAVVAALALLQAASLPAQSWLSRRAEAAADYVALELTREPDVFEAMQRGLAEANLGDPAPPSWAYSLWWTHPTTTERIAMARAWAADRADGGA
jgi:STE24 endopeptidase